MITDKKHEHIQLNIAKKIKHFIITTLIGCFAFLLPVIIPVMIFVWLFKKVADIISPATNIIIKIIGFPEMADIIAIGVILIICFLLGLFITTKFGRYVKHYIEKRVLENIPLYSFAKEIVKIFLEREKSPFSAVALAQIAKDDPDFLVTVLVVDQDNEKIWTVLMPTSPNPTSGLALHLPKERVHLLDISVEEALRSIISCGAGSSPLIANLINKKVASTNLI